MEKIILFQVEDKKEIQAVASNMRIRLIEAQEDCCCVPIGLIAEEKQKDFPAAGAGAALPGSMMVFCDVSDKHLDRFLFEMRRRGVRVDYKAVLTPSNRAWTPVQLYRMLEMERMEIEKAGK